MAVTFQTLFGDLNIEIIWHLKIVKTEPWESIISFKDTAKKIKWLKIYRREGQFES